MLQIISLQQVNTFEKFTLTSGYDNSNTRFVRVKDGFSIGADPLELKSENGDTRNHHVKYSGFLYGSFRGWTMATEKGGYQGWTNLIEIEKESDDVGTLYRVFNPFKNRTLTVQDCGKHIIIDDGTDKGITKIGTFATIFGEKLVYATPFKGLRSFMRLIRLLPEWATIHVNNVSYNESMTLKYDMGVVTEGSFDPLVDAGVLTCDYKKIATEYGVKFCIQHPSGRYFISGKSDGYGHDFLVDQGVLFLDWYGSSNCNSENETTQFVWDSIDSSAESGMFFWRIDLPRELHTVETALLNLPKGEVNDYIVLDYAKVSLGLGDSINGMYNTKVNRSGRYVDHENVISVYNALLRNARKSSAGSAQMLCNLINMSYDINLNKTETMYSAWIYERARLLGTFLHACMKNGKDMQRLWLDALTLQPQSMTDWLQANLVYWIEERHVGYHFHNNSPWGEVRNYQGVIKYIFADTASYYGNYSPKEVSEEEFGNCIVRLANERAYKVRYDAVPSTVTDKHLYIKQQDDPNQYPKSTGKGELSGCVNMGSCQCGDVDWWIKYDCNTLEFSYGNSNWSNRSDYNIPYVGNALAMIIAETNITEGWKVIK